MGGSLLVDGQALASPHPHLTQWTRESYLGPTLPPFRWFQLLNHSMMQKYDALFWLVLIIFPPRNKIRGHIPCFLVWHLNPGVFHCSWAVQKWQCPFNVFLLIDSTTMQCQNWKRKPVLNFWKKQESEDNKRKGPELEQGQRHGRLGMEGTVLALSCCCCLDKSPRIRGLQGTCICCANLFDNNTILPISMIT